MAKKRQKNSFTSTNKSLNSSLNRSMRSDGSSGSKTKSKPLFIQNAVKKSRKKITPLSDQLYSPELK